MPSLIDIRVQPHVRCAAAVFIASTLAVGASAAATQADSPAALWQETAEIRRSDASISAKADAMFWLYERSIAKQVEDMRGLTDENIHEMFRVSEIAEFYARFGDYANRDIYLSVLLRVARELERRGIIEASEVESHYDLLVNARKFSLASDVRRAHASAQLAALPKVFQPARIDKTLAASYRAGEGGALVLSNVEFPSDAYVVVVAGCHMARHAAKAIVESAQLSLLFEEASVLWVTDSSVQLDSQMLDEWNLEFPDFRLQIAYDNAAWKDVNFETIPTFHFFKAGKLIDTQVGWDLDKSPSLLLESLRKIGLGTSEAR
jgi:hypothetical protein